MDAHADLGMNDERMMNASHALNLPVDLWLLVGGLLSWLVMQSVDTFTLKALRDCVRPEGVTGRTKADLGARLIEAMGSSIGVVPVWPNVLSWGQAKRAADLGVFGHRPGEKVRLSPHNTGVPDWLNRALKHFPNEVADLMADDEMTNAPVGVNSVGGSSWTYHQWAEGEYSGPRYGAATDGAMKQGEKEKVRTAAQHDTGLMSALRFKCIDHKCKNPITKSPSFNPGRTEDDGEGPCINCGGVTEEAYRYDISARNNRSGTFPRYLDALKPPYFSVSAYGRPTGFGHVIPQRLTGAAAKVAFTPIDERTGEKMTRTARHAKGYFTQRVFECMDPEGEVFTLLGWAFVEDDTKRGVYPLVGLNRAARAALNMVAPLTGPRAKVELMLYRGGRTPPSADTAATL